MKKSKLKFSEYMQNISRSKSFGKFVHVVFFFLENLVKTPVYVLDFKMVLAPL